jgi:hypothetical protein
MSRAVVKVLSLRPIRLASLSGMCVNIPANVPKNIPAVLLSEALAAGCIPAEESDITALKVAQVEADEDQIARDDVIAGGIQQLIDMNNTADFSPTGVPRISSLKAILLDESVNAKERDQVWAGRFQNI